jgi:hypothetical protein
MKNIEIKPKDMTDEELMMKIREIFNLSKKDKYNKNKVTTEILKEGLKRKFL